MIGETLGGYRIISEIGKGGMGVVYLAEHELIGRKVAIKLLRPDVQSDQVERFFNEARAAAKLHHPGLVETINFGHHTNNAAYIVMEFLAGESLSERLDHEPKLPPVLACSIARSVASALRVAHDEGIIHRDLKPANIFLCDDPDSPIGVRAKVLDFGIAKLTRDDVPSSVMTNSGAVIGTPRYMSPEQCKNARTVDQRTDIYSLGCILYEMLLGTPPFDYDNWAELVGAHLHEEPARPSELDAAIKPELEDLVLQMTAKNPDERFQTMPELAAAIDVILQASGARAATFTPVAGVPKLTRPRLGTSPRGQRASSPTAMDDTMPSPVVRADSKADAHPALSTLPSIEPPRRSNALLLLAALAMVLIAGTVITVVLVTRKQGEPEGIVADPQRRIDVIEPAGAPDAAVVAVVDAPALTVAADAAVKPPVKPRTAAELRIDKLTQTFARRGKALAACLGDKTFDEAVSVRLVIDASGTVTKAVILPPSVAATPEGACFTKVATETTFGPQPDQSTTMTIAIETKLKRN